MSTTTIRKTHAVTDSYTDLIGSIAEAANVAGIVANYGDAEMEIVKGGGQAPAATLRGKPLKAWGEEYAEQDHIWIRCRVKGASGVVGFEAIS